MSDFVECWAMMQTVPTNHLHPNSWIVFIDAGKLPIWWASSTMETKVNFYNNRVVTLRSISFFNLIKSDVLSTSILQLPQNSWAQELWNQTVFWIKFGIQDIHLVSCTPDAPRATHLSPPKLLKLNLSLQNIHRVQRGIVTMWTCNVVTGRM